MLGLCATAAGAVVMTFSIQMVPSVAAAILMALGMGVGNAGVFKLVPQAVPEAVGGASGWVGGLGAFGGFLIPPLLGAIASVEGESGYPEGFALFIALVALALICTAVFVRMTGARREVSGANRERSMVKTQTSNVKTGDVADLSAAAEARHVEST